MKTVITASGDALTNQFDKRFGRASWFCVFDDALQSVSFVENEHVTASNGAGTKAVEKMLELGVKKIISGDFGPKGKELLERFDVQMVIIQEEGLSVGDIVERLVVNKK